LSGRVQIVRYITVEGEYCKGCGMCIPTCPQHVVALSEALSPRGYHIAILTDAEKCTGCCFCAHVCPDAAIEVFLADDEATP
jgi:2-oxoglutarate ferredoxin oxidoreductase subunit delta